MVKKMKKIITMLMLLFFSNTVCFGRELSLEEAIMTGIVNNPQIQAESVKTKISEAQIKSASLRRNPQILLDGGTADKAFKGGISQTFELGGKRAKRVKAAKIQNEVVVQELATAIIDLRSNIRTAYIDLYSAKENLRTTEEILKITRTLVDIAQKREKAGDIAKLDVLQVEIKEVDVRNAIEAAKLEEIQALNNLSFYLGENLPDDIVLKKPEISSDYTASDKEKITEVLINEAKSNRPELKRLNKLLEKNQQLERLARSTAVPDLNITAGPNVQVEDTDDGRTTHVGVFATITMDIPIFNHGQGLLKEVKAERVQLEKELFAAENKITLDIKNAYSAVVKNAEILQIYETELLPKSLEILKKSDMSFKEGKSNILMSLTSQETYVNTQKGYINAAKNYQKSLSDLERALGANNEKL